MPETDPLSITRASIRGSLRQTAAHFHIDQDQADRMFETARRQLNDEFDQFKLIHSGDEVNLELSALGVLQRVILTHALEKGFHGPRVRNIFYFYAALEHAGFEEIDELNIAKAFSAGIVKGDSDGIEDVMTRVQGRITVLTHNTPEEIIGRLDALSRKRLDRT